MAALGPVRGAAAGTRLRYEAEVTPIVTGTERGGDGNLWMTFSHSGPRFYVQGVRVPRFLFGWIARVVG